MSDRQTQLLDDLVWALESPAFVDGPNTVGPIAVDTSHVDVELLEAELGDPTGRVGVYFERLVRFWLEHVAGVELVGAGIQIRNDTRTIGELDFVFRDPGRSGAVTHWEVAVKFFLHDPSRAGSHYPGPNVNDDFESKVAKLFDEQLPRSRDFEPAVAARQALVRGCCFHHLDVRPADQEPARMAPDCERGTWLRSKQVDRLEQEWGSAGFVILDKPFWFTPGRRPRLSFDQLVKHLEGHRKERRSAVMVAAVDQTSDRMLHRFCFVDETW